MSRPKIKLLPPDSGLVPVTKEEAWAWMFARGHVMTIERGGQLYRVLEPGERAAPDMPLKQDKPA